MRHFASQLIREEHSALSAMLRSLLMLVARGPDQEPGRFFDVLRAMLFYIDEFPEKLHHPMESNLLFPRLARAQPELMPVIRRLDSDHMMGEGRVRELQHMLLAWELAGDSRRPAFSEAVQAYVRFYLEHMRVEEEQLLPVADKVLGDQEWAELDSAFRGGRDPLSGGKRDPCYDRLFARIVLAAPSPIGLEADAVTFRPA